MNSFPPSSLCSEDHLCWSPDGEGLIENANFRPPTPDLLKQEGGEAGAHEQAPSDSHAYRRLRSADPIFIILWTSSLVVTEKTLAKHYPTLIWVVGITRA